MNAIVLQRLNGGILNRLYLPLKTQKLNRDSEAEV